MAPITYNETCGQQDCNLFERKDQTLIVTIEVSDLVTIEMRNDVLKSLRELLDSVQPGTKLVIRVFSHEILTLCNGQWNLDWKENFKEIMNNIEYHHLLSLDPFQRQRPILLWDAFADSIRDLPVDSNTLILLVGTGEDLGSKESKDSVADMLHSKVKDHSKLVFFRLPSPSASVDTFLKETPTEFEFIHVESSSDISKMFRHVMTRSTTHSKLLCSDPEKISQDIQTKSSADVEIFDLSKNSTDLLDAIRENMNSVAHLFQGVNQNQGSKTAHQNDVGTSPGGADKEESTIGKENNKISLTNKSKLEDQVVEEGKIENGGKPEFQTFNNLNWIPERIERIMFNEVSLKEVFRASCFCTMILFALFATIEVGSKKQVELLKLRVNWLEKAVFEMQMERAQAPVREEINAGNWKPLNGLQIPEGSLKVSESGSSNFKKAYIARVFFNGELIVGKIVQEIDGGISTWFPIPEEQMLPLTHLQTLVIEHNQVAWIPVSSLTSRNLMLDFAVVGGVSRTGKEIFIGRSVHNRELVAGTVVYVSGTLKLFFTWEKAKHHTDQFEILVHQRLWT